MQSRHPDPVESGVTEAPEGVTVPLPPPSAGLPLCAVVALSDDALLLEALGGAAGDSSSVSSSPSTDRFVDQLVANSGGIALIDAACVPAPLKNFLITLREQFPQLLLLVTGTAQMQAQLAAQIADGTVFRFVHKPASSQRLRLFLDAALRQQAVRDMPAIHPGPVCTPVAPAAASSAPAPGGRRGLAIGITAGALLAAVAGGWIWQHRTETPPVNEPAAAAEAPAVGAEPSAAAALPAPQAQEPAAAEVQTAHDNPARDAALEQAQRSAQGARAEQLAVYLQLVRKRLASGALLDPADDSARTYLDSALALAPDNAEVRATSLAFGEALIAQFRHAIAAGDVSEAQRWLSACDNFHIASSTMSQLSAQLQQLQSAQQAPAVAPTPMPAPASTTAQAQTVPAAATAAGGSATSPPPTTAAPARPAEMSAGPAVAPTAAAVNTTATTAAAAPTAAAPTAAVTGAAPVARATTAPPAATTTATVEPAIVSESSLTRVTFVTPIYPRDALADGKAGWVELEFTVTAEGKVTDVTVTASEPRHVFDAAASYALAHSRYKPVLRDGVPVAQRAHLRERFQP